MTTDKKSAGNKFDVVYILMLALFLVLAVFHMGKPRVGIIDLGRVAAELGVEQKIIEDAQKWRDEAADDFRQLRDEYRALGMGLQAKAAEAQTEEEKLELRRNLTEATREYYESTGRVRERVRSHQQSVLQTFRNRLDPYVREVARKRRLWLVLDRSARLVYATTRVDISDAVVARAKPFFEHETELLDDNLFTEDDLPTEPLGLDDME